MLFSCSTSQASPPAPSFKKYKNHKYKQVKAAAYCQGAWGEYFFHLLKEYGNHEW